MPQAVTHFLVVVILLELFREFFVKNKKSFSIQYVFIGGLAGLLPDLDIAVYYVLSFFGFTIQEVHRTFLHNLFVPLIFVLLGLLFYNFKSKGLGKHHLRLRNIFFVIAFGTFIHLLLDATISGVIMPFYPLSNYAIGLNLIGLLPSAWQSTILPTLDAVMLILWMVYLEIRHKISDVI
jgi:membrane-bound metal-dependent hydrolase YbcI (DUF457 family)